MNIARSLLLFAVGFNALWLATSCTRSSEVPRMTKEELRSRLGDPDVIVLDVMRTEDWALSERKIAGALRENPKDWPSWQGKYAKDRTFVLYCT